jgi:hypothetical protein
LYIEIKEIKKMFTVSKEKEPNIKTAELLLNDLGLTDFSFSGYSDSNGVSVYFHHPKDERIVRVSNHSMANSDRIASTIFFRFDERQFGGHIKSKRDGNLRLKEIFGI